jgi:hypothetical protein
MPVPIDCPWCRAAVPLADADVGRESACPFCGRRFLARVLVVRRRGPVPISRKLTVSVVTLLAAVLAGSVIVPLFLIVPHLFAYGGWPEVWRVRGLCGVGVVIGFLGAMGALYYYWTEG